MNNAKKSGLYFRLFSIRINVLLSTKLKKVILWIKNMLTFSKKENTIGI